MPAHRCGDVALHGIVCKQHPRPPCVSNPTNQNQHQPPTANQTAARFNKAADLINEVLNGYYDQLDVAAAFTRIFIWLRYSATRHLTWQRNYNTQPRILSAAQERLTSAIANAHGRTSGGLGGGRLGGCRGGQGGVAACTATWAGSKPCAPGNAACLPLLRMQPPSPPPHTRPRPPPPHISCMAPLSSTHLGL